MAHRWHPLDKFFIEIDSAKRNVTCSNAKAPEYRQWLPFFGQFALETRMKTKPLVRVSLNA
jgi:hypothetical protein